MATKSTDHTPATIEDVALIAGVSIKTVSRVVNHEPNVRDSTRENVQQAIAQLNYRPNTAARRLAGHRSYLFALLYDDPSAYPNASASYVTNLQGGALQVAREQGYDLLIHPWDYRDPLVAEEIRRLIEQSNIDGLLLAPPLAELRSITTMLRSMGKAVVRISPGRTRRADGVTTNDREVSAEMTRYLASLGHRRIVYLKGHPDHRAMGGREQGFLDGMTQSELPVTKSSLQQGDNSFDSGVACARKLLKWRQPPTAIFAANDDMAAGVLQVAQEFDIDVPTQLSVAGFDDTPLSRQVWPPLTTINQPIFEMGKAAATLLFQQISGQHSTQGIRVDSKLVVRRSTGPAP
ncbi:MAG: LacI family DNA-binding transcriptional regulator [Pseudomonadota bacterium]